MWLENKIIHEDLEYINSRDFIPWKNLRNKTIFVTGTTGLIGQNLVNGLLYANIKRKLNLKILGLVRSLDKANEKFRKQLEETKALKFVIGDVRDFDFPTENIDYIIHGASITSSKDFIEKPEEVKNIAIEGTKHLLELARIKNVSSFVYLSSMEVYGFPEKGHICTEDESWIFDINESRHSYPLAKLECEKMCKEYCDKYEVSTKSIRLAQTFGPGINYDDKRIFAQFARCAIENKDIVLHTKGETERCYLYTADAVTSILIVLLNGKNGEIYNAANPETYCSIKEMAENIAHNIACDKIKVLYDQNDLNKGYFNKTFLNLSINKIEKLGWKYNKFIDKQLNNYIHIYIE